VEECNDPRQSLLNCELKEYTMKIGDTQVLVQTTNEYERRDRAFELALETINVMPAIADESNETPESMIAITLKLANEIYKFLDAQEQNDNP